MHSPSQFQVPAIVIVTAEGDTMCSEGPLLWHGASFREASPFFLQIVIVRGHGNENRASCTAKG